jgi:hypothetical protein
MTAGRQAGRTALVTGEAPPGGQGDRARHGRHVARLLLLHRVQHRAARAHARLRASPGEGATGNSINQNAIPVPAIEPRDLPDAVAWLLSDEARYVTGVSLPVDGGMMLI